MKSGWNQFDVGLQGGVIQMLDEGFVDVFPQTEFHDMCLSTLSRSTCWMGRREMGSSWNSRERVRERKESWQCCCRRPVTSGAPLKHQTPTQRILTPWCHPGVVWVAKSWRIPLVVSLSSTTIRRGWVLKTTDSVTCHTSHCHCHWGSAFATKSWQRIMINESAVQNCFNFHDSSMVSIYWLKDEK